MSGPLRQLQKQVTELQGQVGLLAQQRTGDTEVGRLVRALVRTFGGGPGALARAERWLSAVPSDLPLGEVVTLLEMSDAGLAEWIGAAEGPVLGGELCPAAVALGELLYCEFQRRDIHSLTSQPSHLAGAETNPEAEGIPSGAEALTGGEVGWEAQARSDFLDVVEAASEFPPTGEPLEVVTEILADEPAHDCASQSTGAQGASGDSADTSPCGDDEPDLRSPPVQDSETEGREGDTSGPGHDEQDLTGDCGQDSCEEGDQ